MVGISQPGLPRRREPDRRASGAQGRVAAGAHGRLLHGRRRVSQRRVHAGGELRLLFELSPARADARRAPKPSLPFDYGTADGYEFYLSLPPLAEVNARLFEGKAGYFQEIVDHPNYDAVLAGALDLEVLRATSQPAVLNVGGWFDAEDPMGPLYMYRSIAEEQRQDRQHAW